MKSLQIPLAWQILLAVLSAAIVGYIAPSLAGFLSFIGVLYLRLLSLLLVPFVFVCVVAGLSTIGNLGNLGRIALKNVAWFMGAELLAICFALLVANFFSIGTGIDISSEIIDSSAYVSNHNFGDFILNMVPENIFMAMSTNNIAAIFLFAMFFGFCITQTRDKTRIFMTNLFFSSTEVLKNMILFVTKIAPFGIFFIVADMVAKNNFFIVFNRFGYFFIIVLVVMLVYCFAILPLVFKILTRNNPFRLLKELGSVLFTAFGVSSACASVPMAIFKMREKIGVSIKVANFSVPFGVLMNFNGSSIYYCLAAVFVSQVYGIDMTFIEQIMLVLAVAFISFGTSDIPMRGCLAMIPIMESFGLPIEGFAMIAGGDVLLCMFASFVDMWSTICSTAIIAKSEGETLLLEN